MALPASRNTTYAADVQIKSADLNALQDFIIALYAERLIAPAIGWTGGTTPVFANGGVFSITGGGSIWAFPIELPIGTIVTEVNLRTKEPDAGGEIFTMRLWEVTDASLSQIADTITSGSTGGDVDQTWNDTTNDTAAEMPYTMIAGSRLFCEVTFAQTSGSAEAGVRDCGVVPG